MLQDGLRSLVLLHAAHVLYWSIILVSVNEQSIVLHSNRFKYCMLLNSFKRIHDSRPSNLERVMTCYDCLSYNMCQLKMFVRVQYNIVRGWAIWCDLFFEADIVHLAWHAAFVVKRCIFCVVPGCALLFDPAGNFPTLASRTTGDTFEQKIL